MNSLAFAFLPLLFAAACAGLLPAAPLAGYGYGHAHAHAHAPVVTAHVAPVAVAVGHAHVARSQYHAQDAHGRTYDYGYAEPNGAKKEVRHPDGTVTGTFSHPLPDGRVLTNNYVADEYGFRSSLAPTAAKDFAPRVKAAYDVHAPVLAHTVETVAVPQPAVHVTKTVNYAAPAPVHVAAPVGYYGYHH